MVGHGSVKLPMLWSSAVLSSPPVIQKQLAGLGLDNIAWPSPLAAAAASMQAPHVIVHMLQAKLQMRISTLSHGPYAETIVSMSALFASVGHSHHD